MTEPKFHVGQHVAVLALDGGIRVFPETVVTHAEFVTYGEHCVDGSGEAYIHGGWDWYYEVSADRGFAYMESCLRPINPESEYLESPSHLEVPA